MTAMNIFMCIGCCSNLPINYSGEYTCATCGEHYLVAEGYLKTNFDQKLFDVFKKDYLLNKVLNNNGYISYKFLQDGSISLPDRKEVLLFRRFLESNFFGRRILDAGCGIMDLPGYLMNFDTDEFELIGVDPIDDNSFVGHRIVGCGEFVPLVDGSVDTIVFATSLDHVCNLDKTLAEAYRLLCSGGKVVVWMSDQSCSLVCQIKRWLRCRFNSFKLGYPLNKYRIYPNWTVLAIPSGGMDPFHSSLESPKKMKQKFSNAGFRLTKQLTYSQNEVFLAFIK
jgi:ubiquinone/menaquinone biosynthesis C-methylase UbiE